LNALRLALEAAMSGHGQLILLAGDPGIGKTTLAEQLAGLARDRGAAVLVGRCHDQESAAYWAWVQAIRPYVRRQRAEVLRRQMGAGAPLVTAIIGELRARLPDLPAVSMHEPAHARFHLFDAVTTFLLNAAADRPIVLVLEDLHWADTPSLLLLQFVAREMGTGRLLVIGTYRDVELQPPHPLVGILGDLTRHEHSLHIDLRGLSEADIARLMELSAGRRPSASVTQYVHKQTGGNPLFVAEIVRLLASEGDHPDADMQWTRHAIPRGVRETIERRLKDLTPDCRRVLESASVLGEDFGLRMLERVSGTARDRLVPLLDAATARRLLAATPGVLGHYQLTHALVREVLHSGLPASEQCALHRKAAEALVERYKDNPGPHLSEIAHHFYVAAPDGEPAQAIQYATLAAQRSLERLGYEEAVGHYERALQALDLAPASDEERRCDLLLALADAQAKSGDLQGARRSCLTAMDIARALGDARRSARAVIGTGQVWIELGAVQAELVGPLEEALAGVGEGDSGLRSRLLARLAVAINPMECHERAITLSQQALDMARRVGDVGALAFAMSVRQFAGGPDDLSDRLAAAQELVAAAGGTDSELILEGRFWYVHALLELGDRAAMDREIESIVRGADRLGHPGPRYLAAVLQTMQALLDARLPDAEHLAVEALSRGERWAPSVATQLFSSHVLALRKEQGRLGELLEALADLARRYPSVSGFRCGLAYVHAELGQHENARAEFERAAAHDFHDVPRDLQWLAVLSSLSEVCVFLQDRERAQILYDQLLPYADRNVVAGPGGFVFGSASLPLGTLAGALSRWDDGQRHLEAALALHRRMGAHGHVARTQYELAKLLIASESDDDTDRVRGLLDSALDTAEHCGLARLREKINELARRVRPALLAGDRSSRQSVAAAPPPSETPPCGVFRREGEYWAIGYASCVFRLKDSVGLRYLAELVSHPHEEFLASDLIATVHGSGTTTQTGPNGGTRLRNGSAGPILDRQARESYRRRLRDLRAEHEDARAANDFERARRAHTEIEFLEEELKQALGLGGRARRAAWDIERARVSVTRAIRAAVQKIARNDATLGHHLTTAVRTGTFCSYQLEPTPQITWTR
jgi:tetratricopeptide (TPR) repeat protein/energy-coupling factor transporter ATP-binding protein EcfA2